MFHTNEKKILKSSDQLFFFFNSPIGLFQKTLKKSPFLILRVKIDIAIILSLQTQTS